MFSKSNPDVQAEIRLQCFSGGCVSLWCKNVLFVSIFPHFAHLFRRPGLGEGAQHLQRYNSVQNQMSGCICQPSFHTNSALQGKISAQDLWLGCFSAHQEWGGALSTGLKWGLDSLKDPSGDAGPKVTEKPLCVVTVAWLRALSGRKAKLQCGHGLSSQQSSFLHPLLQLCDSRTPVLYLGRQLHLSQV